MYFGDVLFRNLITLLTDVSESCNLSERCLHSFKHSKRYNRAKTKTCYLPGHGLLTRRWVRFNIDYMCGPTNKQFEDFINCDRDCLIYYWVVRIRVTPRTRIVNLPSPSIRRIGGPDTNNMDAGYIA